MNNVIINIICDLKFFKLNDILILKLINKEFFNSCKYLQCYLNHLIFKNYFINYLLFDHDCINNFIYSSKNKLQFYKDLSELLFDEYYLYRNNKIKIY